MGHRTERKLLTDRDCAEMLSCSRATFWRRVKDGSIPQPIRLCGLTRWKKEEIEQAIQKLLEQRQ